MGGTRDEVGCAGRLFEGVVDVVVVVVVVFVVVVGVVVLGLVLLGGIRAIYSLSSSSVNV